MRPLNDSAIECARHHLGRRILNEYSLIFPLGSLGIVNWQPALLAVVDSLIIDDRVDPCK
jgi:hypothetical protein